MVRDLVPLRAECLAAVADRFTGVSEITRVARQGRTLIHRRAFEMSPTVLNRATFKTIVVTETKRRTGRFAARLEGADQIFCTSKFPFLAAARKLMALGCDPDTMLVMRHAGSKTECLSATVGDAAAWTVKDGKFGLRLRTRKPLPSRAVSPRIAPNKSAATTPASSHSFPSAAMPREG